MTRNVEAQAVTEKPRPQARVVVVSLRQTDEWDECSVITLRYPVGDGFALLVSAIVREALCAANPPEITISVEAAE